MYVAAFQLARHQLRQLLIHYLNLPQCCEKHRGSLGLVVWRYLPSWLPKHRPQIDRQVTAHDFRLLRENLSSLVCQRALLHFRLGEGNQEPVYLYWVSIVPGNDQHFYV